MKEKNEILKMVKHIMRRGKGIPDRRLRHPEREWVIGIGIFFLLAVAGSIANAQLNIRYRNIDENINSQGLESVDANRLSSIEEVAALYTKREQVFESIANQPSVVPQESSEEEDSDSEEGESEETATGESDEE